MQNRDPASLRYSCWGVILGRPTGKRSREGLERPRYDGGSAASRAAPACPYAPSLPPWSTLSEAPHHAPLPHPSRRPDPPTLAQLARLSFIFNWFSHLFALASGPPGTLTQMFAGAGLSCCSLLGGHRSGTLPTNLELYPSFTGCLGFLAI